MPSDMLRAWARVQHGLFTYQQALAAGYTPELIRQRLLSRTWEELEPRVYRALPAAPVSFEQRLHAKVLSVDGFAFGRSAVALYRLCPPPPKCEVLVVRADRNRLREGIHSTRSLPESEVTHASGIPATRPARSIIDACASLSSSEVTRLVDAAVVRKLVRPDSLARRALELNNSKRPGCARVLAAVASQHPNVAHARNDWEAESLRLVESFGLPRPVPNFAVVVGGQRRLLDLAWPEVKVCYEFDGYEPHMIRDVFDDDRVRQNALVADGWLVFRATARTLRRDPRGVLAPIATAIRARGHGISAMAEIS